MTIAAAALAMAGVTVAWRFLIFAGFTNDQYVHVALAQQLLLGDWPLRDFNDPGLPLMYLVSAFAWKLLGHAVWVEWSISTAAFATGAACVTIAGARLARSVTIGTVMAALVVFMSPRDYSYPKVVLYAAAGVAMLAVAAHPSRRRFATLGALAGVSFLFRHDHGLYVGGAALAGVLLVSGRQTSAVVRNLTALGVGTLVVVLPWLVYVLMNDPIGYAARTMEFARAEAEVTVLDALPRFAMTTPFSRDNAAAWLVWLFWVLPIACTAIAIRRKERWPGERAAVLALSALAVAANLGFLRDVLTVRIPDAAVTAALLGSWIAGLSWRLALPVALVTIGATYSVANGADNLERAGLVRGSIAASAERAWGYLRSSHREMAPSRFSRALLPFFEHLDRCTSRDHRLLMTGLFPDILVLAGRGFAGGSLALALGHASPERQNEMLTRLADRPPRFVLVLNEEEFRERYPQIERYVAAYYEHAADWPVPEAGTIGIYAQRGRQNTSTSVLCSSLPR